MLLFAEKPYDDVLMDDVASRAGVSRALLYRYFPNKRDLFAAVYREAADRLVAQTTADPSPSVLAHVSVGLDAHIDYFLANRNTVLAANRVLAGDPVVQGVIDDELAALRAHLLDAIGLDGRTRDLVSAALMGWLVFVRVVCVDWLGTDMGMSRVELRDMCVGALGGALGAIVDVEALDVG